MSPACSRIGGGAARPDLIGQALSIASPSPSVRGQPALDDRAGGLIFGWNSLALILRQQGFYAPSGSHQEDKLTIVYTIGVFAVRRCHEADSIVLRPGAGKRLGMQNRYLRPKHTHAALRSAFRGMREIA